MKNITVFGVLEFFVFHLICMVVDYASANSLLELQNLYRNLTNGYEKNIFPSYTDQEERFQLGYAFYPLVLNSFQETDETISLTMAINFQWIDPRLAWDESLYNRSQITINSKDIWVPLVYLANSVDSLEPIGHDSSFYAIVTSIGYVWWMPGKILRAKCPANVYRFPFDIQTCEYKFLLWGVDDEDFRLHEKSGAIDLTYFANNTDWQIIAYQHHQDERMIIMELTIQRNALYNIILVILPTVLFSLLNPLVFLLPVESGERVSLGMTVLLAYAIFLTLVAGTLPTTSNPMSLLLCIMILIMLTSGLVVFLIILTIHYYYVEDVSRVNWCLRKVSWLCCRKNSKDSLQPRHISRFLDIVFMLLSYAAFFGVVALYFVSVFADNNYS